MRKILAALAMAVLLTGCQSTDRIPAVTLPAIEQTSPVADSPEETTETTITADAAQSTETPSTQETTPPEQTPKQRAAEILSSMTAAEKAGQVILARYPGENALSEAQKYHLGGYTLFGADLRDSDPERITADIAKIQQGSELAMLIAADEEGGTVVRISKYPQYRAEPFPAQSEVLAQGLDAVRSDAVEKTALMKPLGFNMNLAPVCDLPRSETDFIADRAFGTDPELVRQAVGEAVGGYTSSGLICALKHFPGYGDNLDTHTGISLDERPMSELEQYDLPPFREGIAAGAPVVMVSHNIVTCVNDSLPGSLAPEMYALLRAQGFNGAALTDDLSMGAVAEYCGEDSAAVTALCAGADLLCCTDYASAAEALTSAIDSGKVPQERIDEAVTRVLLLKLSYGIIQ